MHHPVLLHEAVVGLNVRPKGLYIDATVGEGGYTSEILKKGGRVLAIDWDREQIEKFKVQSSQFKNLILEQGNFANIEEIAKKHNFYPIDGIIFDLGLSMRQINESGRGFSYKRPNEPLDMRLNPDLKITAADLINSLSRDNLYELLAKNSEEINSLAIADFIISARKMKKIKSVANLISAIDGALGRKDEPVIRRIFQALRIAVNDEFSNLKQGLNGSLRLLKIEGRVVVMTFHSLEDRIVKKFVRDNHLRFLTRKPITAKLGRSFERSAKLRIISFA